MARKIALALLILAAGAPGVFAADLRMVLELRDPAAIGRLERTYRFHVLDAVAGQPVFLIEGEETLLERLQRRPEVLGVEVDQPVRVASDGATNLDQSLIWLFSEQPATTFYGAEVIEEYSGQDALALVGAADVWDKADGSGTRIAFIDTGVDPDHPALRPWIRGGVDLLGTGSTSETGGMDQSLIWLFQRFTTLLRSPDLDQSLIWLFIEDLRRMDLDQSLIWLFGQQLRALGLDQSLIWLFGGDINTLNSTDSGHLDQSLIWLFDENTAGSFFGHGTVVAGLLHLVAPEADLVPIRAFDAGGNSSLFLTTAGVYAAVAQGADVINMSFSIGTGSMAFRRALNFATSRGVALVASAGNSAMDASNVFPAAYPAVAAVGATDFEDRIAEFSNFGKVIDLVAPGKNVVSTYPGGLYATASGTSFSAPMVSGAIAVLMSGGYQGNAAVPALENAADEVDSVNPDYVRQLGRGRINLKGAFESR